MTTTTGPVISLLSQRPEDPIVGETMPHESAALHVTGHALYTDDLVGRTRDVLHAHPVQAPHAHARITRLDPPPAYDVPGWSGCSPPPTCPASTTRASSTTSRCSRPR